MAVPCTNGAKWKETLRGPGWAGQGTRAGGGNNGMSVDRRLGLGNPQLSIAGSRDTTIYLPSLASPQPSTTPLTRQLRTKCGQSKTKQRCFRGEEQPGMARLSGPDYSRLLSFLSRQKLLCTLHHPSSSAQSQSSIPPPDPQTQYLHSCISCIFSVRIYSNILQDYDLRH